MSQPNARRRLTERQAAVLAAVERVGRPVMADLWEQFPELNPSAIKKVLDGLEKQSLVAHSGDESRVYLNGVTWWSTALTPTAESPELEAILSALRESELELAHGADPQEGCVTVLLPLVEVESDLQGLPSAPLDSLRSCIRELEADGSGVRVAIVGISAGPEPLVTIKLRPLQADV
jgi:hypothetical protein